MGISVSYLILVKIIMNSQFEGLVTPDYYPVDVHEEPDFSGARITNVSLSIEDELAMRVKVGQVIDAGNNLSGYSRADLARLCGIKSSQFSKIVKGEAWLNIGNLGLWGFATGITPTDVVQLAPLHANPLTCICWFVNGRLNHLDHDEFELTTKLICRRLGIRHEQANVAGNEPITKLLDLNWQDMYLTDLARTVSIRLGQLRRQLELSQKAFGDILGVTPDTVKRYESADNARFHRGVFSTYRLFVTFNVNPIEITKGSIHHKLRYVQEQRYRALRSMLGQLSYDQFKSLKELALSISGL